MKPCIAQLALAASLLSAASLAHGAVCHVRQHASGANDGSSWADAYVDLQSALHAAACTEIRVAAGVYTPVVPVDPANVSVAERTAAFTPRANTSLYGGYPAAGGDSRDPAANPTILSGDIDGDDANADGNFIAESWNDVEGGNSYRVIYNDSIGVTLDGFVVTAGRADGAGNLRFGGGLFNFNALALYRVRFIGNYALNTGGAIYNGSGLNLSDSVVANSSAGGGGGIMNAGTLAIDASTLAGNAAASHGGAVWNNLDASLTIDASAISDNAAGGNGGAFENRGSLTLRNSTASGNIAEGGWGGGLDNSGGTASANIVNSTFSGNTSLIGGGIYSNVALTLTHVTATGNVATTIGGGLRIGGGSASVAASAIAGNAGQDCEGALAATSSLVGDGSCGVVDGEDGNLAGTLGAPLDPLLGALSDNGGPTPTHLPLEGSPVIDMAACGSDPLLAADQRGVTRPQGAACDMGSVERVEERIFGDGFEQTD